MKKLSFVKALIVFAFIGVSTLGYSADITSTSVGGLWSQTSTWIGGYVPGPFDNVFINGPVYSDNAQCNNITVNPTGLIKNAGDNDTLYVLGNFVNNGTVDYYYHFIVNISGDITNNGLWKSGVYTYLTGNSDHHIATLNNNAFNMAILENKGTGNIYVDAMASFEGVILKFNNDTLFLSANDTLKIKQQYLQDCIVEGDGNASIIQGVEYNGSGPGFNSVSFRNITFQGTIDVGTDFDTHGTVVNEGTIQNHWTSYTLTIADGIFINSGTLRNYNQWLGIDLYSNFINFGTITNKFFNLKGTGEQYISQGTGSFFSCSDFHSVKPSGKIHFLSDVFFQNCQIDLQNDTLLIPDVTMLKLTSSNIVNAIIDCETPGGMFKLNCINNSYIGASSVSNAELLGETTWGNCDLYGEILVTDTLRGTYGGSTVTVHGNLTNNGVIKNHTYSFYLNMEGDVANNGIWQNFSTNVSGSDDQHIDFPPSITFNSDMKFISDISGSSYQWYLNDEPIPQSSSLFWGENSNTLHLGSNVSTDYNGLYYCVVDGVNSRKIFVNTREISVSLKVFLEGAFNGNDMNTGLDTLIPLSQPYNTSPWNYDGTESVATIPPDVVDWVLIELYDTTGAATVTASNKIASQAAFLMSNGTVTNLESSSILSFTGEIDDSLFVVIRHRNHLPVLSATPLTKSSEGVYNYDFSTSVDKAYQSGQKDINGFAVMYGGDANADGIINADDMNDNWNTEAGTAGYLSGDIYFDGQSDNKDKNDIWIENCGISSVVPD